MTPLLVGNSVADAVVVAMVTVGKTLLTVTIKVRDLPPPVAVNVYGPPCVVLEVNKPVLLNVPLVTDDGLQVIAGCGVTATPN
jgi:hypothetical protein